MTKKKLKVFHGLVNYGTQAGLFAKELRKQNIEAISVIGRDHAERICDKRLKPGGVKLKNKINTLLNHIYLFYCFFKYNTFHFYFGRSLFANNWDLKFYKLFGKKVIMEYLGNDIRHYKTLVERYNLPDSHDFYQRMDEHDVKISNRINRDKNYIDYKLCCLPSHFKMAEAYKLVINELLPLAIDINQFNFIPLRKIDKNETIKILHAPTKKSIKGTRLIFEAIEKLKKNNYMISLKIVQGITHDELKREYIDCDIFIAQIGFGWYGTVALEAMSTGRPTCAFIDERYFQYIDYADEIPIINITRDNIADKLRELIENREKLPEIGRKSREFVEKYHDVSKITKHLIEIYKNKVWKGKIK